MTDKEKQGDESFELKIPFEDLVQCGYAKNAPKGMWRKDEPKIRIGLHCKGAPNDTLWIEATFSEAVEVGSLIKENPEKYSGEDGDMKAWKEYWALKAGSESKGGK